MGLFKRNPLKNVNRDDVVEAIIELEKKKDELQDDIFIKEKQINQKLHRGKKSNSLSEKKLLANEVMMLQRHVKASQKRVGFIDKKIYVTEQIKLAIDDMEFAEYNNKSTVGKLFKNNSQLEKFLTDVVDMKTVADSELLDQIDLVDGIMGTYEMDDNLYGESKEVNDILSLMEDDDYEIPEVQEREEKIERKVPRQREAVKEEPLREEDIEIIDPFKED
jgi:hypothetical protein